MEAIMQNEKALRDYQLVLAARDKGDQLRATYPDAWLLYNK